jgi:RsiW-degrading membrane proteinase PrsW (M82 family)
VASGQSPEPVHCVVCDHPIAGQVYWLGNRSFCAEHYAEATRDRVTWPSVWILLAGLVVFGLLMQGIGPALEPSLTSGSLVIVGLILSVLPSLVWLLVFRGLDRLEPERPTHLLGVMVLGALVAGAISGPLRRDLFALHLWSDDRWQWAIPVYTLTLGVLLAMTIYLTVRFSAFLLDEFDERSDGIVYGTAAGLGVAVYSNVRYMIESGGLRLDVGAARIIITALTLASIGGLIGYGLGQVRFERHSVWYLPAIMLLAALLIGAYEWLVSEAVSRSLGYTVWIPVAIAAVFGAVLFGAINLLARSAMRETLAAGTRDAGWEGSAP